MLNVFWMAFLGDLVCDLKRQRRTQLQGVVWLPESEVQLLPSSRGGQGSCVAVY